MFVLIGVFGFLTLVLLSLVCGTWWVLVAGMGLALFAGMIFGSFAIQEAFTTWMAATADWQRRVANTALVFGIVVMTFLIAGLLAHRYTSKLPCGLGGCAATVTTTPASSTTFTMDASASAPAVVEIEPGQRVCWPLEFDNQVDSRVEWRGTTKVRIFTPKPGVGSITIPFTRYQL